MLPMCDHANTVRFFCRNLAISRIVWLGGFAVEALKPQKDKRDYWGVSLDFVRLGKLAACLTISNSEKCIAPWERFNTHRAQKHIFPIIRISFLLLIAETHCGLTLDADDMLLIRQGKTF